MFKLLKFSLNIPLLVLLSFSLQVLPTRCLYFALFPMDFLARMFLSSMCVCVSVSVCNIFCLCQLWMWMLSFLVRDLFEYD